MNNSTIDRADSNGTVRNRNCTFRHYRLMDTVATIGKKFGDRISIYVGCDSVLVLGRSCCERSIFSTVDFKSCSCLVYAVTAIACLCNFQLAKSRDVYDCLRVYIIIKIDRPVSAQKKSPNGGVQLCTDRIYRL